VKFEEKTEDLETEDRREEADLEWMVAAIIGRLVNEEVEERRPVIAATFHGLSISVKYR
jgi:uncharacterized membrane protein